MLSARYLLLNEVEYELNIGAVVFDKGAPALTKRSLLDSHLKSETHTNVSKIEFDFSFLSNASELIICTCKLAILEGEIPTWTSSNKTRLLHRCLHVVQCLNRLEPSESESVLMSEILSKGKMLVGILDAEFLSGDESEAEPAATAHSTPVSNSISKRDLVDRFAGLLDCTLQCLEENLYCVGSIRKIGVTFSRTIDVHGVLDFLGRVKEQRAVLGFSKLRLFEGAVKLFTGLELIWNYNLSLWDEIRSRKQRASESPIINIASMRSLFARLKQTPSLDNQLTYTFANLLPSYTNTLALAEIISFKQLSPCKRLEDTRVLTNRSVGRNKDTKPTVSCKPLPMSSTVVTEARVSTSSTPQTTDYTPKKCPRHKREKNGEGKEDFPTGPLDA
ncbi:hypothetical protein FQA39_LY09489 [Lamprigera yunnana]|nr:hypothetical protein FQA39_LY09489 [Lamprigera yunnana]